MRNPSPTFPPLITGHRVAGDIDLLRWIKPRAADGRFGAGDLAWSDDLDQLHFALVLEPETGRAHCPEILFAAMVAIGDSIGALGPPELAVTYRWPSIILVNEAQIGFADLEISGTAQDDVPDWMILSIQLALRPKRGAPEPGMSREATTLWEEGCADLSRPVLLESMSRHIVNLIHGWSEDGFASIHEQWWGRRSETGTLADGAVQSVGEAKGTLIGLDETGNALIKSDDETRSVAVADALGRLRAKRDEAE